MTSAELRAELLNARVREARPVERHQGCFYCGRDCHDEAERLRAEVARLTQNETADAVNAGGPIQKGVL